MKLSDALEAIQDHINKLPTESYLAHAFFMDDGHEEWQIGFVNPSDEEITVFVVSEDSVTKNPPAEALKKPGETINELVLEDVGVLAHDALASAKKHLSENYEGHPLKQSIVLLQNLSEYGQVYNITLVTETFHMLNIKLSSSSGEVVSEKFDHLMSLKK